MRCWQRVVFWANHVGIQPGAKGSVGIRRNGGQMKHINDIQKSTWNAMDSTISKHILKARETLVFRAKIEEEEEEDLQQN